MEERERTSTLILSFIFLSIFDTHSIISPKGVFSVMRICSRTRDWHACVAPAKNNFIFIFIYKREKRGMRGAMQGVTPLRGIRMRDHAYYFRAHFRVARGARTVLLKIVNTVTQPVEN
jgi:hypothetical protein